ncbi:MAG: undecaprenyl/decaprenyl-phosphate alpha-N-acetylglucosaminyl 1-phosphate transferase [Xanthomonadales bacterium]|nr:undecaprenyl/decaprenyl-phosphate alpha-N-acetylglucosaminyl 1-phosphate transferase [Xanthomonadales bacterium]MBN8262628.1 undecaprenyl/decaprenyl-phosphate alpha-N-acetylglucosaminyl 1-phosphate transferase [Xanthomonadales bacterium]
MSGQGHDAIQNLIQQPVVVALGVLATAVVAWAMIWLLQPLARRLRLLDHPQGRKDHAAPTPVTGGLGIALSLLLLFLLVPLPVTQGKLAYVAGAVLLLLVGLLDDRYDIRWWWRILAQVVAALLMVYVGGVRVEQLGPAFGLGDLSLGVLSVPFTVFATVGLINAINMIDGADGIAGALVAAALAMLVAASWYAGNEGVAFVSAGILGATLGFLLHNFPLPWRPRARVFLGNAGSAFLGYSIAWIVFRLTQNPGHPVNPVLALWLIPIPVIDCLVLIVRRIRQRRSPFSADRDHIHHLMRDAGFSTAQVALTLAAFSLLAGLAIGQAMRMDVPNPLLLGLFLLACAGWCVLTLERERACAFFAALHRGLFAQRSRRPADTGAVSIVDPDGSCDAPGLDGNRG